MEGGSLKTPSGPDDRKGEEAIAAESAAANDSGHDGQSGGGGSRVACGEQAAELVDFGSLASC